MLWIRKFTISKRNSHRNGDCFFLTKKQKKRTGNCCRQAENIFKQAYRTLKRSCNTSDYWVTQRAIFRWGYTVDTQCRRKLYKTVELAKTVLFHTRCGRIREKRVTKPAPHFRNKTCNRSASRGRNGKSINTEAGGRLTRTHNFRNNRNVLCQAKHGHADGRYKRIWIVIDAFLMMYQTNYMDCVAQSEHKTVWKWKNGVRKKPCAVVLFILEKQVKSP